MRQYLGILLIQSILMLIMGSAATPVKSLVYTMTTDNGSVLVHSDIIKSPFDKCQYRHLTLPNGLEALLISEEGLDKASAALDVHVGSFSDPDGIEGLAHFLEHLLFMGTEKYPDENEYGQFLSSHGGHSNAFTAEEHTNFFFDVAAEHLEGALDRFAQFFISPLFNPNGTDRELLAVDSEHKKNLLSDNWRLHQLEKTLSSTQHPYHHFSTGDSVTLGSVPREKGIDIRKVLIEFYQKHYSANLMRLVVYGKDSLDDLQEMVLKRFVHVPNRNFQLPQWNGLPLTTAHFKKLIKVKTVKEMHSLHLTWLIEDLTSFRLSKPEGYISHLLGHEGHGSVLSLLKQKGWATSLSAGAETDSRGYSFFRVSAELSEDGMKQYCEIIKLIFQYLHLIQSSEPEEWIFRESQRLDEINFEFMEKGQPANFAHQTATLLHQYDAPLVLKGPRVALNFDSSAIKKVLSQLNVNNFRIMLASHDDLSEPLREKWYQTEYIIEDLSSEFLNELKSPIVSSDLTLPKPNKFIPNSLKVKSSISPQPIHHPKALISGDQWKLWHKKDDQFGLPKGVFRFIIKSPLTNSSPRNSVISHLYIQSLHDSLTELLYEAQLAQLHVDITHHSNGLIFSFSGLDDKIPLLMEEVMKKAVSFIPDECRFNVMKDRYIRLLKNVKHEVPFHQIAHYSNGIQTQPLWWYWEKLEFAPQIKPTDIPTLLKDVFERCSIEALCHGNFEAEEAISMFNTLKNILNGPPQGITEEEGLVASTVKLEPQQAFIYTPPSIPNMNSVIDFYLQIGSMGNVKLRTMTLLFAQIFHEPFFDQLRTKEQLGYVVRHQNHDKGPSVGLRFLIQSERDPIYLHERIETFIASCPSQLQSLTDLEFQKHQDSLISRLIAKKRKISEESHSFWAQIALGHYEFERVYTDASMVPKITRQDMSEYIYNYVIKGAFDRKLMAVHLWSDHIPRGSYDLLKDVQVFSDPDLLKSQLGLFPHGYELDLTA